MAKIITSRKTEVTESPVAKFIFGDTRFAVVWLVLRVYLGYQWISAAQHKIADPAWYQTGAALKGFWLNAVATTPKPVIAFDWYRGFLQFMIDSQAYVWFSKLVIAGEVLVGAALILGAFTGIAAFIGGFMNWNFMMAGSASTNPMLFAMAVFLILAWKTAGYYGLDRYLLPLLGTPWKPGITIQVREPAPEPAPIR
jgi:thiosulfate dehydrogenase (quinone) large subunit